MAKQILILLCIEYEGWHRPGSITHLRRCVYYVAGVRFASAQVKLLISNIVLKYEVLKCDSTPERLTFNTNSFLTVPCETLWIRLSGRERHAEKSLT